MREKRFDKAFCIAWRIEDKVDHGDAILIISSLHYMESVLTSIWLFVMVIMIMIAHSNAR